MTAPTAERLHFDPVLVRAGIVMMLLGALAVVVLIMVPDRPAAVGVATGMMLVLGGVGVTMPVQRRCESMRCQKPSHHR